VICLLNHYDYKIQEARPRLYIQNLCSIYTIKKLIEEEINEGESNDDPLSIHQDNENKEYMKFDYDTITRGI
jgi:hypothetical protein